MSDDPPGFNSPRRKARFNSRYGDDEYRPPTLSKRPAINLPAAPVREPATEEAGQEPEEPVTGEEVRPDDDAPALAEAATESAETQTAVSEPPPTQEEDDELLPNFRLNRVPEDLPPISPLKDWRWLSLAALLLVGGLVGGYLLGRADASTNASGAANAPAARRTPMDPITDGMQATLDAAFAATKEGRYQEAHEKFLALYEQHPEWWSMGIEAARASLYLHEPQAAQRALNLITADAALPDSDLQVALLHLTNKNLGQAEVFFASATARDPARPDFYFFWGECLRRDGKPRQAADKFHSALLRNQYENAEGLYLTKYWLSVIQADQEEISDVNKAINTDLAMPRIPYEALFAAAARELKTKHYPAAADFLTQAQAATEPEVFKVIIQDPTFAEEIAHPEITPFFR